MKKEQTIEIIELFNQSVKKDEKAFDKAKREVSKKYKLKIPTNIEVYTSLPEDLAEKYRRILLTKPVRSISGVSVIAIMTKPVPCPHGKCSFCPGGVNSHFGDIPQSYTGHEPATMRAIRADYNSYVQVFNRLEQLVVLGQMPEKIELIIMGGTFLSYPAQYKKDFVIFAYKAMNDFSDMFFENKIFNFKKFKEFFLLPGSVTDEIRVKSIQNKIKKLKKSSSLSKEQKRNEKSMMKCVGFTIETRPDYAGLEHAKEMREYGVTRVELGVESIYENVVKKYKRGHTVHDSIVATRILRDFGFKINYHIMLGLSDKKKDIAMFKELFESEAFRPDMLKIYPCMVFSGTELYQEWESGNYKPLTTKTAAEIISEIKRHIPRYVRIMRIQRDIPTKVVSAGVDRTNLRQYVNKLLEDKKIKCNCIRCREIRDRPAKKIEFMDREYFASEGREFFISAEDLKQDLLLGFLRMRFPATFLTKEITKDSVIIRELHVYGSSTLIGKKGNKKQVQHKGIGKTLLSKAEKLAKSNNKKKIVIISGIGVRDYYKHLGYNLQGTYMVKKLK